MQYHAAIAQENALAFTTTCIYISLVKPLYQKSLEPKGLQPFSVFCHLHLHAFTKAENLDYMQNHLGSALEEYLAAYSLEPENVLILLCIGVTYLNQSMSRKVPNRHHAVLAAFAFLQVCSFADHREKCIAHVKVGCLQPHERSWGSLQMYRRWISSFVKLD